MNTSIGSRRGVAALAVALTLAAGVTACGGSPSSATGTTGASTGGTTVGVARVGATFGPACDRVPTSGPGSFDGMATASVATAAGANPQLSTLAHAIKKSGLRNTLDTADGITVFAPSNSAFAKLPAKRLTALLTDRRLLRTILNNHVVAGELTPDQLTGAHKTLAGGTIKIAGTLPDFSVGTEAATILCGNVHTANATVYIIDTVLSART